MFQSLIKSKANAAKGQALSGAQAITKKAYFKFVFWFAFWLALPSFFCFFNPGDMFLYYIGIQIFAVMMGIIHLYQMKKRYEWWDESSLQPKLIQVILILLIAMVLSGLIVYTTKFPTDKKWIDSDYSAYMFILPTALLPFTLPIIFISAFQFALAIPDEEYKKWYYPEKIEIPDMDAIDFTNSYVLSFQIHKKESERDPAFMKFKAPLHKITFGELFYMYIFEYNDRNRESMIEYMDKSQRRYGWLFYIKPKKFWQVKKYIDPSLTITENKIKEHDVIVPFRV